MLNNKALQVPYGTRDVLPGEAGARRIIENKLASTFKAWGYDEVVTPTFEYLDTFAAAGQLSDSSFFFFVCCFIAAVGHDDAFGAFGSYSAQ